MKQFFIALSLVLFISCDSDDGPVDIDYKAQNEQEILDYIALNELDAKSTSSGLYYVINKKGDGAAITANSDVTIKYKGYFTNGTVIEESTEDFSFNLGSFNLKGIKEGLQLFNEGGNGIFLIPAHLTNGSSGDVLIYEIEIVDYVQQNKEEILKYVSDNNLNATASESGLYYVIEEEGTGTRPTETSEVTVVYKGYYTDNTVFDESNPNGATFNLSQVISGWIEGIQYFKEGGKGKLLIPSSLAYGRYGNQSIPGGAVIIFDIDLKAVN